MTQKGLKPKQLKKLHNARLLWDLLKYQQDQIDELRNALVSVLGAKLDLDAGVSDTDYESILSNLFS